LPEPLRIAFPGCGFITGVHSRALQSLRGAIDDQRLMDQIYATIGPSAAGHITPDQMAGHIGQ
jgi:hypothetical protein